MDGKDLGATARRKVFIRNRKLTRTRLAGAHGRTGAALVLRIEPIGVEVDTLEVIDVVDGHREGHNFNAVALREGGGHL